jgi:2-oxoglutarate/2-oxoacid ferredoxin oxidoreductase subunit alpha
MGKRLLMKGNEAIGEAAIIAGCRAYFCYPITPQTEVAEYLARRMPEVGGVFLQGESEVAVSYMLFGAAAGGRKVFTTSSSPGISLMAEGMSYLAAAELPVVIGNVMRNGPGLGGILPCQADYFQATKGAGHGDYRFLVLAPASVQEAVDMMILGFELAEKYRTPVMIVADGMIGQMMEPVEIPEFDEEPSPDIVGHEEWATIGAKGRGQNLVKTLYLKPEQSWEHNLKLKAKYDLIEENEIRYEELDTEGDLDVLIVSFGTMARICKTAMAELKEQGVKVGMLRPQTLWPFPLQRIRELAARSKIVFSVELSMGQMVEDVDRAVQGQAPVHFYGKTGGLVPIPAEVTEAILAKVEDK